MGMKNMENYIFQSIILCEGTVSHISGNTIIAYLSRK